MPKCFKYNRDYEDEDGDPAHREFRCYLESKQCSANVTRGNRRCHNQSVLGLPYCYAHTISKLSIVVKPSPHVGHDGKGVFAHNPVAERGRVFEPGDLIYQFLGQKRSTAEMRRRYGSLEDDADVPYGIQLTRSTWLDGACLRGIGMLINHAPEARANVRLRGERNRDGILLKIVATKNINHGTELLMDWTVFQPWHRDGQNTHRTYDCKYAASWDRAHRGK